MSARKGDKARFHIQRMAKIRRKERMLALREALASKSDKAKPKSD